MIFKMVRINILSDMQGLKKFTSLEPFSQEATGSTKMKEDTKNEEGLGYKKQEIQAKAIPRIVTGDLDLEYLVY